MNRRAAIAKLTGLSIGVTLGHLGRADAAQGPVTPGRSTLRKIATEEACTFPEIVDALRAVVRAGGTNLDLHCIDKIGADNIMWAIDYPYQPTAPDAARG